MMRLVGSAGRAVLLAACIVVTTTAAAEPATVDEAVERARAGIDFVDNDYLKARRAANPDLVLLDVRSESEYEAGHVPAPARCPGASPNSW